MRGSQPAANPADLPRIGYGSLTDQTTRALLDAILDSQFPDGRLPAEPDLADLLHVSRTTIRAALQSLERLGMVSRAPGRGTYIRPYVGRESILLQRMIGFREMLASRHTTVDVVGTYTIEPHPRPDVGASIGVTQDTEMLCTSKVFMADGSPALHICDHIPLTYLPEADRDRLRGGDGEAFVGSIFLNSQGWPGRTIDHAMVELVPRVAPDDPDFPLSLEPGAPYILLAETHFTEGGEPVAFTEVHVDDRYVRFQIVRQH